MDDKKIKKLYDRTSTVSVLGLKKSNYINFCKEKSSHFYNGCFYCIINVFRHFKSNKMLFFTPVFT